MPRFDESIRAPMLSSLSRLFLPIVDVRAMAVPDVGETNRLAAEGEQFNETT